MTDHLFHVAPGSGCERIMGADTGVQRIKLTAAVDLELWAACATGWYDYGCNHELVRAGDTVELPRSPIGVYDAMQGPHYHVRQRAATPHTNVTFPWIEVRLPLCTRTTAASTAGTTTTTTTAPPTLKPLAIALVRRAAYASTAELERVRADAAAMYRSAKEVAREGEDAAGLMAVALEDAAKEFARGSGHPLASVRAALHGVLTDVPVLRTMVQPVEETLDRMRDAALRWVRRAMNLTSPAERLVLLHAARALFAMAVANTGSISGGVAALGETIAWAIARCAHEARRRIRSVALRVENAFEGEVPAWMSHAMHVVFARGLHLKEEVARLLRRALAGGAMEAAAGMQRLYAAMVEGLGDARKAVVAMAHVLAVAIEAVLRRVRRMTAPLVFEQLRRIFDAVPSYVDVAERLLTQA